MMRYTSSGRWMFFNSTLPMRAKVSGIAKADVRLYRRAETSEQWLEIGM
jgi:hypothetical protein